MIFNNTILKDVSKGKGEYGIGASAVPYNNQLYIKFIGKSCIFKIKHIKWR